jgi:hypothetical protein
MCEICKSMLAAEHTEQPGAELCPMCHRFPLDVDAPLDLSQWDYVDPDFKDAIKSNALEPPPLMDSMPEEAKGGSEDLLPEDVYDDEEEPVRTCYHCYQAESEQAELCPVCGDSYLSPHLRSPHQA